MWGQTLFLVREKLQAEGSLWIISGAEDYGERVSTLSLLISLQIVGWRSLSTSFWISHKGNWVLRCYWVCWSIGEGMVQSFQFHLAEVTASQTFQRCTPLFHFLPYYSLVSAPIWFLSLSQLKKQLSLWLNPTRVSSPHLDLSVPFGPVNQRFHKILFFLEFCWHHTLLYSLLPLRQFLLCLNCWLVFFHLAMMSWSSSCFNSMSSSHCKRSFLTSDSSDH